VSLTAAAIRMLADKGLSASEIADLAEANSPARSSAAVRQKRYRDNKRDVTRDVTPPPIERNHTPPVISEPDGSDAAAPVNEIEQVSPDKVMFDAGRRLLTQSGIPDAKARQMLGKWRKQHGVESVIAALGQAQREGAIEPISFIEGCFRHARQFGTPTSRPTSDPAGPSVTSSAFAQAYEDLGVGQSRPDPQTLWDGLGDGGASGDSVGRIAAFPGDPGRIRGSSYSGFEPVRAIGHGRC